MRNLALMTAVLLGAALAPAVARADGAVGAAVADVSRATAAFAHSAAAAPRSSDETFRLDRFYGLGITEHRLDGRTAVVGWRLGQSWYVGQRDQQGAEDGLSLVWQGERKQVSLSLDEIRFVRRF